MTVNLKETSSVVLPTEAETLIFATPYQFAVGVTVKVEELMDAVTELLSDSAEKAMLFPSSLFEIKVTE